MNSRRCNNTRNRSLRDAGSTVALAALTSLALITVVGWATDQVRLIFYRVKIQSVVDAGVLSAANQELGPNSDQVFPPPEDGGPEGNICSDWLEDPTAIALGGSLPFEPFDSGCNPEDPDGHIEEVDDREVPRPNGGGGSLPNTLNPTLENEIALYLPAFRHVLKNNGNDTSFIVNQIEGGQKTQVIANLDEKPGGNPRDKYGLEAVDHLDRKLNGAEDPIFETPDDPRVRSNAFGANGGDDFDSYGDIILNPGGPGEAGGFPGEGGDKGITFEVPDAGVPFALDEELVAAVNWAAQNASSAREYTTAIALPVNSSENYNYYGPMYQHSNPNTCAGICPNEEPVIIPVSNESLELYTGNLINSLANEASLDVEYIAALKTPEGIIASMCVYVPNIFSSLFGASNRVCANSAAVNSSVAMIGLFDKSGSMQGAGDFNFQDPEIEEYISLLGNPEELQWPKYHAAKIAMLAAVDLLGPGDCFGLISYASGVEQELNLGCNYSREQMQAAVLGIGNPTGATAMYPAGEMARSMFAANPNLWQGRKPVVLLTTDGNANAGVPGPIEIGQESLIQTMHKYEEVKADGITVYGVALGLPCESPPSDGYGQLCSYGRIKKWAMIQMSNDQDRAQQEGFDAFPPLVIPAMNPNDWDGDAIPNSIDNCPFSRNTNQADGQVRPNGTQYPGDGDGLGNKCDCPPDTGGPQGSIANVPWGSPAPWYVDLQYCYRPLDVDGDGINNLDADGNLLDNCPMESNIDQADSNGNGIGDACDERISSMEPPMSMTEMAEAGFPVGRAVENPGLAQFIETVKHLTSSVVPLLVPWGTAAEWDSTAPTSEVEITTPGGYL